MYVVCSATGINHRAYWTYLLPVPCTLIQHALVWNCPEIGIDVDWQGGVGQSGGLGAIDLAIKQWQHCVWEMTV